MKLIPRPLSLALAICVALPPLWGNADIIFITGRDIDLREKAAEIVLRIENGVSNRQELAAFGTVTCGNPEGFDSDLIELTPDDIPDFEAKVDAMMAQLGLNEQEYTDEWIADLLTSAGYNVSIGDTPNYDATDVTLEIIRTWEYLGDLTTDEIARLEAADLIIIGPSAQGKEMSVCTGDSPCTAYEEWNAITTPLMILSNYGLPRYTQFGWRGWAWIYSFGGDTSIPASGSRYGNYCSEPRSWQPLPFDLSDPAMNGITPDPQTFEVPIFRNDISQAVYTNVADPEDEYRLRGGGLVQFSNNPNFDLSSSIKIIMAPTIVSWDTGSVGFVQSRFHVLNRWPAGQVFYEPDIFNPGAGDFTGWAPASTVPQVAGGPRVFFSVSTGNGVRMLSDVGEQVFFNLVEDFTGVPPVFVTEEPVPAGAVRLANGNIGISFVTEVGSTYEIRAGSLPSEEALSVVRTIEGDGTTITEEFPTPEDRQFFQVVKTN